MDYIIGGQNGNSGTSECSAGRCHVEGGKGGSDNSFNKVQKTAMGVEVAS